MTPADHRTAVHDGAPSQRILAPHHDAVGIAGEEAFAAAIGQRPDYTIRGAGDGGCDFTVHMPFTVDVKTFRKAFHLLVEEGKTGADIYVLARYDDATGAASLLGWAWGATIIAAPVADFGYGVRSHHVRADRLRPMSDLFRKIHGSRTVNGGGN